ncbi:hypothetical protein GTQ99_02645 [Kineococcus sp. T13]|uniref:hypothetical protein n=1 Tax=Kineococcus vitellinus TaxID=2696565 RepID=UPI0014122F7D|nr:hypothetical protein [Kineococcus vitellinus]NAZ74325.1 hypothetical protein [Kineococcus vitellinus]
MTEPTDAEGWNEPLTGLPLPPPAVRILDSLLPMRGRSRRGYNRPPDTLAEAWQPTSQASLRDWLGFEPPTLPSLTADHGLIDHFVVHPFEERPPRRAIPPGTNVTFSVLYVPADIAWAAPGSYAAAAERGMVTVSLLTGYGAPWPQVPRPTWQVRSSEASGDSVVVPLGSALIGVQRRRAALTRLAWSVTTPSPGFNVEVWAHLPPVVAVSALVKDWASTRLRPLPHPH